MKLPFALLFSFSIFLNAQETPPIPGSSIDPLPPTIPTPAPDPNNTQPAPQAGNDGPISARRVDPNALAFADGAGFDQPIMTGLEAASFYEIYSGKRVIMTAAVAQSEVAFTMKGPLTNAEVARFLKLTLLQEGLALIPVPDEPNLVRLVPSGPITGPGPVPKDFFTDEFDLPSDDQLVSYQMIFKYLKPEDALNVLNTAVGQLSASGRIAAVPSASSLIITENSSLIRQMIKIQKAIDIPNAIADLWVEVTYGDVDEIAERMNEIYNDQGNNNASTRTTRANDTPAPNVPPNPGTLPGAGSAQPTSGEAVPLKIIGVRRTSRILLVGRPADLVAAEAMIRAFDQPSSGNTRQTFRLRYLRVGDFLGIAEQAISVTLGDSAGGGAGGGASQQGLSARGSNGNLTSNRNNRTTGQQGLGGGANSGGANAGGGGGNRAQIEAQEVPTAPESISVGNTLLVGDNVANTVIVNGPPHHIEIIRELIRDLDTESQQVALSAIVGSYALGDGLNFGVDLARALQRTSSNFAAAGTASFGLPSVVDPGTLTTLASVLSANGATGQGVSIYGLLGDDFGVFINALETQTKFKTLERTVLTTRNNRVATLSSGQRIAVPSSTFVGGGVNGSTTNVQFRDVVLELLIQPLINSENQITLEISLVRDSIGNDRTVGELTIPDINTEELTTSVTVQDGSAVILGGIITEQDRDTQRGIPVLSRIPGIGRIFGRTDNSGNRAELIIMIQPRILNGQGDMNQFRDDYSRTSRNAADAASSFPQRSGMLPADGTMPEITPDPKGGILPAPAPQTPISQPTPSNSESKIRRKSGRPGR